MGKIRKDEIAIFAGGCFWCMAAAFEKVNGILSVECGYTGGYLKDPSYEQVCYGHSGHYEAVRMHFDLDITTYQKLMEIFWTNIDPTDSKGQFCDVGNQYKSAIFYVNEKQREIANQYKKEIEKSSIFNKPIATLVLPYEKFYKAEEYHQNYHKKCPFDYKIYYNLSGREPFFKDRMKNLKKLFKKDE